MYSNAYTWNLEKWYWIIYLQSSNGETDTENRLMDMGRGEDRVRSMERVTWKQPRFASTDEWIRKWWYIYTMDMYQP